METITMLIDIGFLVDGINHYLKPIRGKPLGFTNGIGRYNDIVKSIILTSLGVDRDTKRIADMFCEYGLAREPAENAVTDLVLNTNQTFGNTLSLKYDFLLYDVHIAINHFFIRLVLNERVQIIQMPDSIKAIQESIDNGDYVPEKIRRMVGL